MYCASAGLSELGLALAAFFGSPTTETVPLAPERFSLVQTFLGFFASAGGAAVCGCAAGAGELVSGDCAAAEQAARRTKMTVHESERGIKPPVSQGRGH